MPTTTSHGGVTPFALTWPRTTERTVLRLLTLDDVDAMHAYRRLPEVCRHLTHDSLTRAEVEERIRSRLVEKRTSLAHLDLFITVGVVTMAGERPPAKGVSGSTACPAPLDLR